MNENIKDTVREKAAELAGGAFEKQKGTALSELDSVASALRQASSALSDNSTVASKLVTTLADRVESAGRALDGKELGDVVDDFERFARRNPATFISGAIAVGFLASRFLKSSSSAVQKPLTTSTSGATASTQGFAATGGGADLPMSTGSFSDDDDMTSTGSVMDRPIIAGVAALAVGAIVGTIIRETDREHELFGRHREQLTARALETARQTVARGVAQAASTVASRASGAAGDTSSSGGGSSTGGSSNTGGGKSGGSSGGNGGTGSSDFGSNLGV